MAYCTISDLLIGDMTISDSDKTRYLNLGAEDIDAELGTVYELPLGPLPLPAHVQLLLKRANRLVSSGRLIMDKALIAQDQGLHAYGKSLYDEGMGMVYAMATGKIDLQDVIKIVTQTEGQGAMTTGGDVPSGVDWFYDFVSADPWTTGPVTQSWRPGT